MIASNSPSATAHSSPPPGSALRGARLTGADREALRRDVVGRYAAGESIRSLAASTGRSYGFVHTLLVTSDITMRGRGGAHHRKN